MVVLSCAICTKSGKALLSRQFMELSKVRIEGLLAAFPKLMGTGKQHTFIETDTVRYVYQPLESLYILLITNKNSNILEDLETLHLLAKLVPEYCRILEEAEITKYAFDLIFAFDEVIAMGYKERVTVQQVRHFTTMESHEEERARVEEAEKQKKTKKAAQEKIKTMEKKKAEERKAYGSGMSMGGMGGGSMSGGPIGGGNMPSPHTEPPHVDKREKEQPAPARSAKGMSLLGKTTKKSDLAQVLKEEKIVEQDEDIEPIISGGSAATPAAAVATEGVHVVIEEQLVVQLENDGGLQNMEIKGGLSVTVFDSNISRVKVITRQGDTSKFQFKTHPNIDKNAFSQDNVLRLKDGARAFPTASPAPVLRWRLQTTDENFLPLNISCWPSPGSDGQVYVTLEYELLPRAMELHNVTISIPVPGSGGAPVVSRVDGNYDWEAKGRTLVWKMAIIDHSERQGGLEFSVPNADPRGFFPLHISFNSNKTFCDLQVVDVISEDKDSPVKYSEVTSLTVDQFEIV